MLFGIRHSDSLDTRQSIQLQITDEFYGHCYGGVHFKVKLAEGRMVSLETAEWRWKSRFSLVVVDFRFAIRMDVSIVYGQTYFSTIENYLRTFQTLGKWRFR